MTASRSAPTNRGLWLARHTRLTHRDNACDPGCPVCDEHDGYQADYSSPPPSCLAAGL